MHGIVTYHDGINFGAYLQVYALHNTLKRLGYPNVIINYKGRRFWKNEYRCFLRTKNPALLLANIIKIVKFRKAQRLFNQTKFSFSVDSFRDMHFDALVFGSDEIWNYRNPLVGFDPAYFGGGFSADQLVSYAASCGNLDVATGFTPEICGMVSRFSALSVRDENSSAIVRNATGREAEIVLDPTFLHDFSGEEIPSPISDFIMVYTVKFDRATEAAVRDYADSKGKRLISVGYMNKFCDKSIIGIGPFEFLGYLKAADEVITSMFHGTLFSIKYGKQFCIIPEAYRTNKLSTILSMLALKDRVVSGERSIAELLAIPIDYERVRQTLEKETDRSLKFLQRALTSGN
jgi:Polysaccharide pyruvyl transferase